MRGGKGAAVKTALGRYDSHVNVLKVCDNGLAASLEQGREGGKSQFAFEA